VEMPHDYGSNNGWTFLGLRGIRYVGLWGICECSTPYFDLGHLELWFYSS
jgi:hypothetical protein